MQEVSPKFRTRLSWSGGTSFSSRKAGVLGMSLLRIALAATLVWLGGCGAINVGKWKGIERTGSDEEYYLAKDIFLTAGSASVKETHLTTTCMKA